MIRNLVNFSQVYMALNNYGDNDVGVGIGIMRF